MADRGNVQDARNVNSRSNADANIVQMDNYPFPAFQPIHFDTNSSDSEPENFYYRQSGLNAAYYSYCMPAFDDTDNRENDAENSDNFVKIAWQLSKMVSGV